MDLGLDGKTHLTLVVENPERSSKWYERVLGFREIRSVETSGIAVPGGPDECAPDFESKVLFQMDAQIFLGLARPRERRTEPFSQTACGLQHFGLHVRSRAHLDQWMARLDALGIGHSGIHVEGPGWLVRFRDPDGIPIEVYWNDTVLTRAMFVQTAREGARASARRRRQAKGG